MRIKRYLDNEPIQAFTGMELNEGVLEEVITAVRNRVNNEAR